MRILIANRGEIACRIARTCRSLGIESVGVYSHPDRNAAHVDAVDIAVALGGSTPAESYLRADAVVRAALDTEATAVHPGYGFLAENADFARRVLDAGLRWIGPTPDQIRLLGDKIEAKRAAEAAGVPTTEIIEVADGDEPGDVPLPALVKAASGGGGRGMRIVRRHDDLADAVTAASREATAAFGDGTVFIEPYIERGRHVEVQIFGDDYGNLVHLGTRECSIQRRNQKIVEEAPASALDDATRERLHEGALALGRHVGYVGAGTVEFMVGERAADDGDATDAEPTITFLEVNTRLQVEHPVTEAVTGTDLVAWQIAVAHGHPLPMSQDDIRFDGHAIEVRVVAEDPAAGWLPSTGRLDEFAIDDLGGHLRVDTGFRAGGEVSADYDSLLAKVVAHDPSRKVAADRVARAMRTARIVGVRTNAPMLAATMVEPDFRAARTFTSYLDDHPDVVADIGPAGDDRLALVIAATIADQVERRRADDVTGFAPSGWRNLRTRGQRRRWIDGDTTHQLEYVVDGADVRLSIGPWPEPDADDGSLPDDDRRRLTATVLRQNGGDLALEIDGRRRVVTVRRHPGVGQGSMAGDPSGDVVVASSAAGVVTLRRPQRWTDHDADVVGGGPICPLPGTVIAVHVEAGQEVEEGELLMVVEAMKMEHRITAATAATVAEVRFGVGDRVDTGDLLVALDTMHDADDEAGTR